MLPYVGLVNRMIFARFILRRVFGLMLKLGVDLETVVRI